MENRTVFGAFECLSFPDLGIDRVIAKIDTGADSGAIHCVSIEEVTGADGTRQLQFVPMHADNRTVTISDYAKAYVRSSTGHRLRRFLINTRVVIDGKEYSIRIGLSDRSDMQYDVLIGRRFLATNHILVDVVQHQDLDKLIGE